MNSQPFRYRIASYVHTCRIDRHVVMLDLRRDRYFGFNWPDAGLLGEYIEGWPVQLTDINNSADTFSTKDPAASERCGEILQRMLNEGVLVTNSAHSHTFISRPSVSLPGKALIEGYTVIPCKIRWIDMLRFITASTVAVVLLRWRSLEAISLRIYSKQSKYALLSKNSRTPTHIDLKNIQKKVAIFLRLRPLFFTAQNECLFNSLALSDFLRYYGFFPKIIFGVATKPFRAHCWLQHDAVVIDDTPEYVGNFTPIMIL